MFESKIYCSIVCLGLLIGFTSICSSQDYIGAGNSSNIKVYSSDQHSDTIWIKAASRRNTINGNGLDAKIMEASRFLSQASLGFDRNHIDEVADIGIKAWIENQINLPQSLILPEVTTVFDIANDTLLALGYTVADLDFKPNWEFFNYAWWDVQSTNQDLLRHRVATALSEIMVISKNSDLADNGWALASYYDILAKNAFGNYEDLLLDVTLHPAMGFYLSHLNNPKSDPANNVHPDENYAREVMQLFSIGLYELNQDGSRKLDTNNELIPTYGQPEIKEFAKIFTGLGVSDTIANPYDHYPASFGRGIWTADMTKAMRMYDWAHEEGPKTLLYGESVPTDLTGMADVRAAIKNLSNHPNVAPFICFRLIQRLVKSNPSPEYILRVTNVFNNNGSGQRGDLGAVVKAILLDEEARLCEYLADEENSKLREPLLRYTHFARAVDKFTPTGSYWNIAYNFYSETKQDILRPPSVFNFFLPDHAPVGAINNAGLYAPEFNLHDSRTAVGYMNEVRRWNEYWGDLMHTWDFEDDYVTFDQTHYRKLAKDGERLINELDRIFTHGNMTPHTRNVLRSIVDQIPPSTWYDYTEYRVNLLTYAIMISPDYNVMR